MWGWEDGFHDNIILKTYPSKEGWILKTCPSKEGWINVVWSSHTLGYWSKIAQRCDKGYHTKEPKEPGEHLPSRASPYFSLWGRGVSQRPHGEGLLSSALPPLAKQKAEPPWSLKTRRVHGERK